MVYIDMDKPTECGGCPMLLEDDQCCLQAVWHNSRETQYAACPLVEVKESDKDDNRKKIHRRRGV